MSFVTREVVEGYFNEVLYTLCYSSKTIVQIILYISSSICYASDFDEGKPSPILKLISI